MSTDDVRATVSEDIVLELLLGVGLDRNQAISLVDHQPERSEQSSESPAMEDQRSEPEEGEESQSAPLSSFQCTVMQMMEKMSQRLDDLSTRMDRSSRASTLLPAVSPLSIQNQPDGRRNWADIPVEETPDYSNPLVWEDEPEDSTRPLLQASENTARALKTAFGHPMGNQARLQARKQYMPSRMWRLLSARNWTRLRSNCSRKIRNRQTPH